MKKNLIFKAIIDLFILGFLIFLNANNIMSYVINIFLLLILLAMTLKKKPNLFLLFLLIFFSNSVYLFTNEINIIILSIYYAWTAVLLFQCFCYVFNLGSNKVNISFNILDIPRNKEYLIAIYLGGPKNMFNSKAIITKSEKYFIISLEDSNKIDELNVNFGDIKKVTVNEKPYIYSNNNFHKVKDTFNKEEIKREFDSQKSIKVIKSYEIILYCKDTTIKLLSFNYPHIFNFII